MTSCGASQKPSCFVGQVANLRRIVNPPLVGQPILAAAGFQPAFFVSRFVGFCRKGRSRRGSSVALVRAKWVQTQCYRVRGTSAPPGKGQDLQRL